MSISECFFVFFIPVIVCVCVCERAKKYEVAPVLKGEARGRYAADGNPLLVKMATVQLRHEDI